MRIEKAECNYQVTECDLKFGEQITLDGELLIPVSVLDKIREEITEYKDDQIIHAERNEMIDIVLGIIDKYREGSEYGHMD